jgi:DNA-binding transcriptional MocR family regulator
MTGPRISILLPVRNEARLLPAALARQVAFMPGEAFFADEAGGRGCLRLNFSHASPADAARGLAALAGVLRDTLRGR